MPPTLTIPVPPRAAPRRRFPLPPDEDDIGYPPGYRSDGYDEEDGLHYPVDDGIPMGNTSDHNDWIAYLGQAIKDHFAERPDIWVAMDVLWYPVHGQPDICVAPDILFVSGRPNLPRPSYHQWKEDGQPLQVVLEFVSKSNRRAIMQRKWEFYNKYGVEEYIAYDLRRQTLRIWVRPSDGGDLAAESNPNGYASRLLGMRFWLDDGKLIVTGPDNKPLETRLEAIRRADAEKQRAAAEKQRAAVEKQRADSEKQRAIQAELRENAERIKAHHASQRATQAELLANAEKIKMYQAEERAEAERLRAERLAEKLRSLGLNPDEA